jgi:hypothetical protein
LNLVNLELINEALTELDPTLEHNDEDESYRTALVLVSALAHGPFTKVLADFTHLPREFVEAIRQRMIQAELWTEIDVHCDHEIDVHCDHWFGEGDVSSSIAFWLDLLIGQGRLLRRWNEEQGRSVYCLAEYAWGKSQAEQRAN